MGTQLEVNKKLERQKISNCCGAPPANWYDEECFVCSDCGEHCDYVEADD